MPDLSISTQEGLYPQQQGIVCEKEEFGLAGCTEDYYFLWKNICVVIVRAQKVYKLAVCCKNEEVANCKILCKTLE